MEITNSDANRLFILKVHDLFKSNVHKNIIIDNRNVEIIDVDLKDTRSGINIRLMFKYKYLETQVIMKDGGLGSVNVEGSGNLYLYYDDIRDNDLVTIDTFNSTLENHLKSIIDEVDEIDKNSVELNKLEFW